mgnify:CR=1 FL=1
MKAAISGETLGSVMELDESFIFISKKMGIQFYRKYGRKIFL